MSKHRPRPTQYADLAQIADNLPLLVLETRRRRKLTLEQAGEASNVGAHTLRRIETGHQFFSGEMSKILRWLGDDHGSN